MKKNYQQPVVELLEMDLVDILTASVHVLGWGDEYSFDDEKEEN